VLCCLYGSETVSLKGKNVHSKCTKMLKKIFGSKRH
jgi:hypothetical protein